MKMKKITCLLLLLPGLASAHEGHGLLDGSTAWHYLLEGPHNLPLWAGIGGLTLLAGTKAVRRAPKRNGRRKSA